MYTALWNTYSTCTGTVLENGIPLPYYGSGIPNRGNCMESGPSSMCVPYWLDLPSTVQYGTRRDLDLSLVAWLRRDGDVQSVVRTCIPQITMYIVLPTKQASPFRQGDEYHTDRFAQNRTFRLEERPARARGFSEAPEPA